MLCVLVKNRRFSGPQYWAINFRNRLVAVATGWTAGVRFRAVLFAAARLGLEPTQISSQWITAVMQPERESDHSKLVASLRWLINTPHIFMAWCLIKHRDSFTFY
jgi:hypothetical protein